MELLASGTLRTLIQAHEPPCIYQPTHRRHPDNQQDPIRFRNLVWAIEDSLAQKYSSGDTRALLAPLEARIDPDERHSTSGRAARVGPPCRMRAPWPTQLFGLSAKRSATPRLTNGLEDPRRIEHVTTPRRIQTRDKFDGAPGMRGTIETDHNAPNVP